MRDGSVEPTGRADLWLRNRSPHPPPAERRQHRHNERRGSDEDPLNPRQRTATTSHSAPS